MELRQLFRIIHSHRCMIVVMFLSAVITAVLMTYVLSSKYRSSTQVLIRPKQSVSLVQKKEEILDFPVSYFTPIEAASKTYTEIVKSPAIAERVVVSLGLDKLGEDYGTGFAYYWRKLKAGMKQAVLKSWALLKYGEIKEEDPFDVAVGEITDNLNVKPIKDTYLFDLQAESKSPQLAAEIANVTAAVLVEYLQSLNNAETETAGIASAQKLEISRQKLDESRKALASFKEREGIASLGEQMEAEVVRLSDLEAKLNATDAEIDGMSAKLAAVKSRFAEQARFLKSSSKTSDNPIIMKMRTELAEKELKLASLTRRYTDDYREIRILKDDIAETKRRIREEPTILDREATTEVNPLYDYLRGELTTTETGLEDLKARREALARAIQEKKKAIEDIPRKESELVKLQLAFNLAEESHKLLSKENEEIKLAAIKGAADIRVVYKATAPLYPVKPIKVYNAAVAGVLSLIIGVGVALLLELLNIRIRSIEEAQEQLAVPVLTVLPHLGPGESAMLPFHAAMSKHELPDLRRRYLRATVRLPISVRRLSDGAELRGETIDLSLGGVACSLKRSHGLEENDKVEAVIDPGAPENERIVARGFVARSLGGESALGVESLAIRFENMPEESASRIDRLVMKERGVPSLPLPERFEEPLWGLRSDLQLLSARDSLSSFLVVGCRPGEGATTILSNLAISLVSAGRKVVLVDADMKNPGLHSLFEMPNDRGLSNALYNGSPPHLNLCESGLAVLTSGPPVKDSSALLGSGRMRELIGSLRETYEIVLLDCAPILTGPDTALLASIVDGTILLMNSSISTKDDVTRAKQILERSGAGMIGVILNDADSPDSLYYIRS